MCQRLAYARVDAVLRPGIRAISREVSYEGLLLPSNFTLLSFCLSFLVTANKDLFPLSLFNAPLHNTEADSCYPALPGLIFLRVCRQIDNVAAPQNQNSIGETTQVRDMVLFNFFISSFLLPFDSL